MQWLFNPSPSNVMSVIPSNEDVRCGILPLNLKCFKHSTHTLQWVRNIYSLIHNNVCCWHLQVDKKIKSYRYRKNYY